MTTKYWPRGVLSVALAATLSECQVFGAAKAVRITGGTFDKAECLAREFKDAGPCPMATR